MALRAKLYFERHIVFEISRSEISKTMCLSKQYSAAAGGKRLLQNSLKYLGVIAKVFLAAARKTFAITPKYFREFCKSLLPPAAAEYCFERHIVFEISLREISKTMCLSKYNLARSAIKILFTQPYFAGYPRCFSFSAPCLSK